MKKITIILIILLILSFNFANSQIENDPGIPTRDGVTMDQNPESDETPRYNLKVFIKTYKVVFEQQEPILIRFLIKNQEQKPIELKIAKMFFLNFSFVVKNMQNQMIGEKNSFYLYKMKNRSNRKYRTIRLSPGDIYGKTIDISQIINFKKIGHYIVQGYFYPVPFGFHDVNNYPSNKLKLQIRYGRRRLQVARRIAERERQELKKKRSPYETIEFILNSKLKKNWKHFFHYIDLSRLIQIYPDYYKRYQNVQPSKRASILDDFREYLKNYLEEQMVSFDVYRTVINRDDAQVFVNIIYIYRGTRFKKRYVFRLYQRGYKWYLYHFYVMNLRLSREELQAQIERQRRSQRTIQPHDSIPRYD